MILENKQQELRVRDYTVNKDLTIKHGETHEHKGKAYVRSYIGGAAFDHEKVSFEKSDTGRAFRLWKTDRKRYYKEYGAV